jgi:predicted tellurium resistance membrane protein TerC
MNLMFAFVWGQEVGWGDLGVVGLLVLLEGVLSIDNALVLGLLAKRLPKHQRSRALT